MASAAVVSLRSDGSWAFEGQNEDALKAVIDQLANSKVLETARTYCTEFAQRSKANGSNFTPIILIPFNGEMGKEKTAIETAPKPAIKPVLTLPTPDTKNKKEETKIKQKNAKTQKRFVMQRLTDFDLMSQW